MPDWTSMFAPKVPLAEIVLRGTIMYLVLFVTLRFFLKRQGGAIGVPDLLVVLVVADGSQTAFVGKAESITESLLLIFTVLMWTYALNWVSFRVDRLKWLTAAPPIELVRDGVPNRKTMRQQLLTMEELLAQLREQGVDDVSRVKVANMEGDGQISVVERDA